MYSISFTEAAEKRLHKLPKRDQLRIAGAIEMLANNPFPPASLKLKGREGWRLRVGDYRVIYKVENSELLIEVIKVGHRRDVYHN